MKSSYPFNFDISKTLVRCGRLHIKRSPQNNFMTLTDLNNKVVAVYTLGRSSVSRNKRIKRSPATLERLFLNLRSTLIKYSLNAVTLLLRSQMPRWTLKNMERFFLRRNIRLIAIENRRRAPHGFLRQPKKPRK
jgi:ribosomal protein S11